MRARWLITAAAGLWLAALGRDAVDDWIDATVLPSLTIQTSTEVLDRNGQLLRAYTVADGRWRLAVDLDEVDPRYIDMLLTYEDRRFRDHPGVDWRGMLRAGWQAVTNGRIVSGGSTLTMQVARLLEEGTTGQVGGKLRQMRVALALERRLSKDEILSLYLLLAPYGGNLEGIRAASLSYFGKEPARLTPAESALLVAIPQSARDPPPRPRRRPGRGRARPGTGPRRHLRPDRRRRGTGRPVRTRPRPAQALSGLRPPPGRPRPH
jgi:penicillin-binding protein 1C